MNQGLMTPEESAESAAAEAEVELVPEVAAAIAAALAVWSAPAGATSLGQALESGPGPWWYASQTQ